MSRADDLIDRLQARVVELEQQRGGVVLPEQDGSNAQIAFWAGFEAAACGLHGSNIRTAWNDFKGSDQFKRLNPPCECVSVLKKLLSYAERQICAHEETHRGGAIWEICDSCGGKWADDEGGKPKFVWSKEIKNARAILAQQGKAVGDE